MKIYSLLLITTLSKHGYTQRKFQNLQNTMSKCQLKMYNGENRENTILELYIHY